MIPLFDLHCDTFLELYKQGQKIECNSLHISLDKATNFAPYIQVAAFWSDYRLSNDEAFKECLLSIEYLKNQEVNFITNLENLSESNFIFGVEDARLLNGDLSKLEALYLSGMRVLTLNWKDNSSIGGGWNTNFPLTSFGKEVINRCFELGILIDLSHSSEEVFEETIKLAKHLGFFPFASHSNSFTICNHKRNLTDTQFKALRDLGSIVGISFVPEHLDHNAYATVDTIVNHINHFLKLDGENTIALGSDFDGVSSLPEGITSIESLNQLYSTFVSEFGEKITQKIFFENAYTYFKENLRKEL